MLSINKIDIVRDRVREVPNEFNPWQHDLQSSLSLQTTSLR